MESSAATVSSPGTCDSQNTPCSRTSWSGSFRTASSRIAAVSDVRFCDTRNIALRRRQVDVESRRASTALRIVTARGGVRVLIGLRAQRGARGTQPIIRTGSVQREGFPVIAVSGVVRAWIALTQAAEEVGGARVIVVVQRLPRGAVQRIRRVLLIGLLRKSFERGALRLQLFRRVREHRS